MLWHRLYTGIHALKPKSKPKSGAISESITALNVDQTKVVPSGKWPLPPTPLGASAASKRSGTNGRDQNVVGGAVATAPSEPVVEASAVQKKVVTAPKSQVDKTTTDARKKSLKRL